VLDFYLAKASARDEEEVSLTNSPTLSNAATQQGIYWASNREAYIASLSCFEMVARGLQILSLKDGSRSHDQFS